MSTLDLIAKYRMQPINKMTRDGLSYKKKKKKKISQVKRKSKIREKICCDICGQQIRKDRLNRHMRKAHNVSEDKKATPAIHNDTAMSMAIKTAQKSKNQSLQLNNDKIPLLAALTRKRLIELSEYFNITGCKGKTYDKIVFIIYELDEISPDDIISQMTGQEIREAYFQAGIDYDGINKLDL